jgi:uncharacterized SAM-binding protein YcdF (DUF218 family)
MNNDTFKLSKWTIASVIVLFVTLALFIFKSPLLEKIGTNLVYKTEIVVSDAIVVLAGSQTGNRMEEAVRVFDKGMGKVIVFSGYTIYPGMDSHIGMKQYAMKLGVPEDKIVTEKATGEISTWGEALSNLKKLKDLKAKSFILVTSSFHTHRSHWVYERAIKSLNMDIVLRVQPAADPKVPYPGWWKIRSGQKSVFIEYIKFLYYVITY